MLDLFPVELIHEQIHAMGKPKLVDINLMALKAGAASVLAVAE